MELLKSTGSTLLVAKAAKMRILGAPRTDVTYLDVEGNQKTLTTEAYIHKGAELVAQTPFEVLASSDCDI